MSNCIICKDGYKSKDYFKEMLKEYKRHVNSTDLHYRTFLYLACDDGHLPCVKTLIDMNANVDMCDDDGWTPLYISCEKGYHNITTLLLEHCAQVDKCDNYGCSPLYVAAENGNIKCISLLLLFQANINIQNHDGWTPNHIASAKGHSDSVAILIKAGADLDLKNDDGEKALEIFGIKISDNLDPSKVNIQVKLLLELHRTEHNWRRRKQFLMFLAGTKYLNNDYSESYFECLITTKILCNKDILRIIMSYI